MTDREAVLGKLRSPRHPLSSHDHAGSTPLSRRLSGERGSWHNRESRISRYSYRFKSFGVSHGADHHVTARPHEGTAISRSTLALFVGVGVSYTGWLGTFSIYRYLLPIEMLSGAILMAAFRQIARPVAVPVLMIATAMATWFTTNPLEWGHIPFRDHYLEISAPRIEPGTMVLNVGNNPVAFLIPFLDPGVRWLSLDNNLLRPEQGNALVARERSLIAGQHGPILVLHAVASSTEVNTILAAYGLVENPNQCQNILSNLGSETYALCAASRQWL